MGKTYVGNPLCGLPHPLASSKELLTNKIPMD